jgi:hypothetical protein
MIATGVELRVPIRRATAVFLCRDVPWDGPWVRLARVVDTADGESGLSDAEDAFGSQLGVRYLPLLEHAHHDRQAALRYLRFAPDTLFYGAGGQIYADDCGELLDQWPEKDVCDFLDQLDEPTRRQIAGAIRISLKTTSRFR